jgi:DNA-binding MarR family transcriptional regulator
MEDRRAIFLMQQTYATLFSIANKVQVKGDQYMKNLTSRQLMTMMAIVHLPEGKTSLNNIARMLGTTKQSVKQLITLLENRGYVLTVPNQSDKRAVNVIITQAGNQVLYDDVVLGVKFFNDLFHDFTLEEIETLWNLLKKLYRFDGEEQDGFEEEIEYKQINNGEF